MKSSLARAFARCALVLAAALAAGCGGKEGSTANPPTDLVVVAGENSATLTWTMEPDVEYWVFKAAAPDITTTNWASLPEAGVVRPAVSPQIVGGLTNGRLYSFTVNGRRDGGPGGAGTPSQSIVPRMAGGIWTPGAALGTDDLRGATFAAKFVVVGANGTILTSTDGRGAWTTETSGTTADLNAAHVGFGGFIAAGAGGTVLMSSDAVTWTAQTTGTTADLYGACARGDGQFFAVGAGGTVVTGSSTVAWTAPTTGTTADLYAITQGTGRFVAVGAGGTIITTTDGTTWTAATSNTTANLRAIVFANNLFVAVGDGGALVTSPDGTTWTAQAPIDAADLRGIAYGLQFVAVGSNGAVYTSADGVAWTAQNSGTTQDLLAVARGARGFTAVGVAGTNLTSY